MGKGLRLGEYSGPIEQGGPAHNVLCRKLSHSETYQGVAGFGSEHWIFLRRSPDEAGFDLVLWLTRHDSL